MTTFENVVSLMLASKLHRTYTLADIERLILPPIILKQYRLLQDEESKVPLAFVSWAYLTEEASQGYIKGTRKLAARDWNGGTERWTIDFISPFVDCRKVVNAFKKLNQHLPPSKHIRYKQKGIILGRNGRVHKEEYNVFI